MMIAAPITFAETPATGPVTRPSTQPASLPAAISASQPVGAKLEFRVAVKNPDSEKLPLLTQEEVKNAKAALEKGQVGQWWIGDATAKEPKYIWLPIHAEKETYSYLVTGQYKDKTYILLHNTPFLTILSGKWGLKSVYQDTDGSGLPCVGFKFDENGAKLFYALTTENLHNPLAIIVNGEVYSAPTVRSAISDTGVITGKFTVTTCASLLRR